MKNGFLRIGAVSPNLKVANCKYNTDQIMKAIDKACDANCDLLVLPELSITGYTCGDLFFQKSLINNSIKELLRVKEYSKGLDCTLIVGLPLEFNNNLYNSIAVIYDGEIYGITPSHYSPVYDDVFEGRYFSEYTKEIKQEYLTIGDSVVPFGNMIFKFANVLYDVSFAIEIGEELFDSYSLTREYTHCGASVILNPSAKSHLIGSSKYIKAALCASSAENKCAHIYCEAGEGESTTDSVFAGKKFIFENSKLISEAKEFSGDELLVNDIDIDLLKAERKKATSFTVDNSMFYVLLPAIIKDKDEILRDYPKLPFADAEDMNERCEEIISIQAHALKKRLVHTNCKSVVLGLSGGLDSTLALIACVEAFDLAGLDRANIKCITMPCFGTSKRTYNNACKLCDDLGCSLTEIDIKDAVICHFKDINQDINKHDVTYENSQARERTQILMDLANQNGGLVIGTGDLSELALGWATYNGDHMSMYAVNADIPKTLVRYVVKYYADKLGSAAREVLYDILDTPVSPELLPPDEGKISQKTEDLVGPYELHDFFLFYFKRYGFTPNKIFAIARKTFKDTYNEETILKWLKTFLRRFITQQFKRSCMPDGVKIGSVALSPRGDLKMPSDADFSLWLDELAD